MCTSFSINSEISPTCLSQDLNGISKLYCIPIELLELFDNLKNTNNGNLDFGKPDCGTK